MIAENIAQIQKNIVDACARADRDPHAVTLIAVSKTHPAEAVLEAIAAGAQHFGENRVEEAEIKIPLVNGQISVPITWHMIGHIQSRKAKDVVPLFGYVHSVDTLKLAAKLSAAVLDVGKKLAILLEVNVSGEESKYGFQASAWHENAAVRAALWEEMGQMLKLPGLRVRGLMTMAPIAEDMEQTRPVFSSLAQLRAALVNDFAVDLPDLSMGMTDDYPVAVEEGATLVRVGRAIFGEREMRI
ncbi:MAG: YggS family pyridoxal phosphate-dependent enzyme [Chloroflexota bacterium]